MWLEVWAKKTVSAGAVLLVVLAVLALVLGVLGPVGADSFADDDGGFYEPALDALAESGILDGTECGEGLACPDEEMERWVVAVWLVRALEEADPEGVSSTRFEDVDTDQWWDAFRGAVGRIGSDEGVRGGAGEVLSGGVCESCPDGDISHSGFQFGVCSCGGVC